MVWCHLYTTTSTKARENMSSFVRNKLIKRGDAAGCSGRGSLAKDPGEVLSDPVEEILKEMRKEMAMIVPWMASVRATLLRPPAHSKIKMAAIMMITG